MSGPFGSSQWMYQSAAGFYDHEIDGSLRFEGKSAPSYLSRTFTAGSNTTWTLSWWFKPDNVTNNNGTLPYFFATSGNTYIRQQSGQNYQIEGNLRGGGGTNYFFSYAPLLRDTSAWYHCVIAVDTSQGTSSNRVKFYLNGEQQTTAGSLGLNYPPLNHNTQVNTAVAHRLGAHPSAPSSYAFSGYMSDINFVDGSQLNATSFGETKSGIWIPKEYSGSYGTNGFHLEFAGNANDTSGNGNNWTENNISSYDYVPDSPTNNFSTLNSTNNAQGATLSQGNLRAANATATDKRYHSTFGMTTGKWYWEVRINTVGVRNLIGIWSDEDPASTSVPDNYARLGVGNGSQATSGTYNSGAVTASAGDILSFAFDADAGELYTQINGTPDTGSTASFTGLASDTYLAGVRETGNPAGNDTYNFGQDSTFAGATTAGGNSDGNGIGDFKYAPPSGYLALCTSNLPAPAIDPNADETPEDYFNTVTWTGNGSTGGNAITGVGFQPEFVWVKQRNGTAGHVVHDIVRGTQTGGYIPIAPSATNAESDYGPAFLTAYGAITSLDSDGFTVVDGNLSTDNYNGSGDTYVAWNWLAGGTASSNTDGSVTSTVSANTDARFSIVTHTGTGSTATVGHGLGVKPDLIIHKNRDAVQNWKVYHSSLGATKALELDNTAAAATTSAPFNNTEPTSTVMTVNNNQNNQSGDSIVSYVFANTDGYLKAGSYIGNGSTDGPFVYTGFRPAWVMIKKSSASGTSWQMYDNKRDIDNVVENRLIAEASNAEGVGSDKVDFLSSGFKLRENASTTNASGATFVYLCFAEQPFKYANAR
jgi:hypothetical protein